MVKSDFRGAMRKFEDLEVWQTAKELVLLIYSNLSGIKDYGFRDQIQRAAVSIMNNIAEGSEYGSDAVFVRYLKFRKVAVQRLGVCYTYVKV